MLLILVCMALQSMVGCAAFSPPMKFFFSMRFGHLRLNGRPWRERFKD